MLQRIFVLLALTSLIQAIFDADWDSWTTCRGTSQSPIVIDPASAIYDVSKANVHFNWATQRQSLNVTWGNDGQTAYGWAVPGTPFAQTTQVDDVTYRLEIINFRWGPASGGSEHIEVNKAHVGELELIHHLEGTGPLADNAFKPGAALMVSIFLEEAPSTKDPCAVQALSSRLPRLRRANASVTVEEKSFRIDDLLTGQEFYRYSGSLSVTPCTEGTERIILSKPLKVSRKFMKRLRTMRNEAGEMMTSSVNRPTQPLNHRTLFKNFPSSKTPG